jgi:hypothetical protein
MPSPYPEVVSTVTEEQSVPLHIELPVVPATPDDHDDNEKKSTDEQNPLLKS